MALAAGTTLDAWKAGSFSPIYTVAIQGYPYLLTDGDTGQAVEAWASRLSTSHYAQALGGLFVDLENAQQLDPYNPFPHGGQCLLHVSPDNETFRRDTHRRGSGWQTELTATVDRNDATLPVKSTAAAPSSGEGYIGTECFAYTGKTGTSFTTVTRGKYSPFTGASAGWGEYHRVGLNDLQARIPCIVSEQPRRWIGKWVGVWLHKLEGGLINDVDDALLVYAGRIESISIEPNTGAVLVELKHVLDCILESSVGGDDQWSGEIRNLIRLDAGMRFYLKDVQQTVSGGTLNTDENVANDLTVISGTPANANEVKEGFYTPMDLFSVLNKWFTSEKQAGRTHGSYSIGYYEEYDAERRIAIWWYHSTSTALVDFTIGMPNEVRMRLGFDQNDGTLPPTGTLNSAVSLTKPQGGPFWGGQLRPYISQNPLLLHVAFEVGTNWKAKIQNPQGTLHDQLGWLPSSVQPPITGIMNWWGVFLIDERIMVVAEIVGGGTELHNIRLMPEQFGLAGGFNPQAWAFIPSKSFGPEVIKVKQIMVLEMRVDQALPAFVLSSGTAGYNHATHDSLPHGIGLAIPSSLAGAAFISSVQALPVASSPIVLVIDKVTTVAQLLSGDLQLRRASFRWRNDVGQVTLTAWSSPTTANALETLDETNKAAPEGNIDHHRTTITEDGTWAKPHVKIMFNRNVNTGPDDADGYRGLIQILDAAAIDDLGGQRSTLTIKARNTYGDYQQTGAGIDAIAPGYVATMPFFSRPARIATRSIAPTLYPALSIGDVVLFSDDTAIDPETGERGIQARAAVVIRHRYSLGGLLPNQDKPNPTGGEVDLYMVDVDRVAEYVPCADVDDTQTNGGYNAGTFALTCYAHRYSEASDPVDASRFANGYAVRVIERDPADPASPQFWDNVLAAAPSGNVLFLQFALTGWDSSKRYRVIFDDYADCTTAQRTKTFQADDADAMIADLRAPFEYGAGGSVAPTTLYAHGDAIELPPDKAFGDGVRRDVGHEVALIRLVNNLHDFITAHHSPMMANDVLNAASFGSGTYKLVMCRPIFLGHEILLNDVARFLHVSPYFRSATGASASARITLARRKPAGSSLIDVDRGIPSEYTDQVFTTTSTSFSVPTAKTLDCRMKGSDGCAWLLLEVTALCETWGIPRCYEGPRVY